MGFLRPENGPAEAHREHRKNGKDKLLRIQNLAVQFGNPQIRGSDRHQPKPLRQTIWNMKLVEAICNILDTEAKYVALVNNNL